MNTSKILSQSLHENNKTQDSTMSKSTTSKQNTLIQKPDPTPQGQNDVVMIEAISKVLDVVDFDKIGGYPEKTCPGVSPSFLFQKNTPSFRCFTQQKSSISYSPFNFPPLEDDGAIHLAFTYVVPEPVFDELGVTKYQTLCKEMKVVPMKRVIKSLSGDILDLRYFGLTEKQLKPITSTLKINTNIKTLHLQDNWMTNEMCSLVGDMLTENSSIVFLNMQECRIGPEGAERINEGVMSTQFITHLNLSFNSLGNDGIKALCSGLTENTSINILDISHNNLDGACAPTLEKILKGNNSIQELNLAWNSFNTDQGNKILCNGLMNNPNVLSLDLSWNGISTRKAMLPICKYLKATEVLERLNLSYNMITGPCAKAIKGGIAKNYSLLYVKLGNNPLTTDEAQSFAQMFANKADIPLQRLDLENIFFTTAFLPLRNKIKRLGRQIDYAGILSNYEIFGPDIPKLLFERCKYLAMKPKKKKAKKDFGHFILSLPDKPVTKQDFEALIKKNKVKKLDKDLVNELVNRFQSKGQKVNVNAMREAYMALYPDTRLPPPKPKKKKKKKGKKGKKKDQSSGDDTSEAVPVAQKASMKIQQSMNAILKETLSGNIKEASAILQQTLSDNATEASDIIKKASFLMQKVLSGDMPSRRPSDMSTRMNISVIPQVAVNE